MRCHHVYLTRKKDGVPTSEFFLSVAELETRFAIMAFALFWFALICVSVFCCVELRSSYLLHRDPSYVFNFEFPQE